MESRVPLTYNRAVTAIVQGRRRVERAQEEVRLALEILCGLSEEDCGGHAPSMPLLVSLEEALDHLRSTARTLREVGTIR